MQFTIYITWRIIAWLVVLGSVLLAGLIISVALFINLSRYKKIFKCDYRRCDKWLLLRKMVVMKWHSFECFHMWFDDMVEKYPDGVIK